MQTEDARAIDGGALGIEQPEPLLWPSPSVASHSSTSWASQKRPSLAISERRLLLIVTDVLLIVAIGYALAWDSRGPGNFPGLALPLALYWLALGQIMGTYDLTTAARPRACLSAVLRTAVAFAVSFLLLDFFVHYLIARPKVIMLVLAVPLLIGLWRLAYIRLFGAAHFQRKVLVVGAGAAGLTLLRAVRRHPGHGVAVIGILDDDASKLGGTVEGVPVVGGSSAMWPLVEELRIEEVVIATNQAPTEALLQGLGTCYEHSIAVSHMPSLYEEVTGQVPVEFMGPHWFGAVQLSRAGGGISVASKRLLDILLSGLALLLLAPVILILGLIVRLSSKGPVLHRQDRIGLHGKPFTILKFRTMRADAELPGEPIWASLDDPRATKIGRWLRRTHLDELPQFLLVVKGDMSLVGPRPERPEFVRDLERAIPLYRARYSVRPGIAGWAQLNYPYGASVEDALAKLRYDLYYVKNRSTMLDLAIIGGTLTRVFGMRGR
jgi:exopolysaccharide biosynthesis polyprenyl glycosylphosphotransferase